MKITIPCKITFSTADKCWYVEAPGFYNGILTDGDTMEEAKKMAAEALSGIVAVNLKHGIDFTIPPPVNMNNFYNIPLESAISCALWLRTQREARHLTMNEVAEKLGVKYQVYQKLENPKTSNPTLKTIRKLENVFETELICS